MNDEGSNVKEVENENMQIIQTGKKLQIFTNGASGVNVSIFDLSGNLRKTYQSVGEYDLSILPTGIYIVKAETSTETKVIKTVLK